MDDSDDQMNFDFSADDLLEFPRDIGETGYYRFHYEQRQACRELEQRFGLVLNQPVRVRLKGRSDEVLGRLLPVTYLEETSSGPLPLRLGDMIISHEEIDACTPISD